MNKKLFTSKFIKTNIAFLKIIDDCIFVGIGGNLHLFHILNKNVFRIKLLQGEDIQGVDVNKCKNEIIYFSGVNIGILKYKEGYKNVELIRKCKAKDWIITAKYLENNIITLSRRNILSIWDFQLNYLKSFSNGDDCILYSSYIVNKDLKSLFILGGTAFGSVLIWKPDVEKKNINILKGHNGVILSIDYSEKAILSTSDDRSSILWVCKNDTDCFDYKIQCKVFGHSARIFAGKILKQEFISAGEDSVLNVWDFDGNNIETYQPFQGGTIRYLDYHNKNNLIICGCDNGGLLAINYSSTNQQEKINFIPNLTPRCIAFLNSGNLAAVSQNGIFAYYDFKNWNIIDSHEELRQNAILKVSNCRKLIALAGFKGKIIFYLENQSTLTKILIFQPENSIRIYGIYWLNCDKVLTYENGGKINLWNFDSNLTLQQTFKLPWKTERHVTAALLHERKLILSDRKGHIHIYGNDENPCSSMFKAHSFAGITKLILNNDKIISLGKDSHLNVYHFDNDIFNCVIKHKLPFSWLADIFDRYILAFSSDNFVIYDMEKSRVAVKIPCGGGHRSWDFFNNKFVYLKDKEIHLNTVDVDGIFAVDYFNSFHNEETNCVKVIHLNGEFMCLSGGEDTYIRYWSIEKKSIYDLKSVFVFKSHLSSIRTMTMFNFDDITLMVSAGGREQIILSKIYQKNIIMEDNYYESLKNEETRIMDTTIIKENNQIYLLAACSNGYIKIFKISQTNQHFRLNFIKNIRYKMQCLLKITKIQMDSITCVITMATDGLLIFWDFNQLFRETSNPLALISTHQSGINSYGVKLIDKTKFLILTGGDDNCITLSFIEINDEIVRLIHQYKNSNVHYSLISGAFIFEGYFITAAIEQRIALFKWNIIDGKIICKLLSLFKTAIADVQGISCILEDDLHIFVYGNGVEYITLNYRDLTTP